MCKLGNFVDKLTPRQTVVSCILVVGICSFAVPAFVCYLIN